MLGGRYDGTTVSLTSRKLLAASSDIITVTLNILQTWHVSSYARWYCSGVLNNKTLGICTRSQSSLDMCAILGQTTRVLRHLAIIVLRTVPLLFRTFPFPSQGDGSLKGKTQNTLIRSQSPLGRKYPGIGRFGMWSVRFAETKTFSTE